MNHKLSCKWTICFTYNADVFNVVGLQHCLHLVYTQVGVTNIDGF